MEIKQELLELIRSLKELDGVPPEDVVSFIKLTMREAELIFS